GAYELACGNGTVDLFETCDDGNVLDGDACPASCRLAFVVDSAAADVDADPGDAVCATAAGECTLRAAIQEANALAGDDEIVLPAGGLSLSWGTDEDACVDGDLDVTSDIAITGAPTSITSVGERIFDVHSGT